MRINDKFSIYNKEKNSPTYDFENQMVDLRTPSYWDKFKTWQKPYQALFLSVLTLIVVGIFIGLCLLFLGSEGKHILATSYSQQPHKYITLSLSDHFIWSDPNFELSHLFL